MTVDLSTQRLSLKRQQETLLFAGSLLRAEHRMHMLPNKARDEYFVGERFIDELALRSSKRLKFAAGTHGGNPVAHNSHGLRACAVGVRGDDLARHKDLCFGQWCNLLHDTLPAGRLRKRRHRMKCDRRNAQTAAAVYERLKSATVSYPALGTINTQRPP